MVEPFGSITSLQDQFFSESRPDDDHAKRIYSGAWREKRAALFHASGLGELPFRRPEIP
jgi:hypothetical protein